MALLTAAALVEMHALAKEGTVVIARLALRCLVALPTWRAATG